MVDELWHCPCGSILQKKSSKNRHLKTKKHIRFVNNDINAKKTIDVDTSNTQIKHTSKSPKNTTDKLEEEHQKLDKLDNICSICLDEYSEPKKLSTCGHTFCKACINKWLERKSSCPCCRRKVCTGLHRVSLSYKEYSSFNILYLRSLFS